ncbi:hypothetical protein D3C71_1447960 [compost metagenome]
MGFARHAVALFASVRARYTHPTGHSRNNLGAAEAVGQRAAPSFVRRGNIFIRRMGEARQVRR